MSGLRGSRGLIHAPVALVLEGRQLLGREPVEVLIPTGVCSQASRWRHVDCWALPHAPLPGRLAALS